MNNTTESIGAFIIALCIVTVLVLAFVQTTDIIRRVSGKEAVISTSKSKLIVGTTDADTFKVYSCVRKVILK